MKNLSHSQFQTLSSSALQHLMKVIEDSDVDELLECENVDGVLTISNNQIKYIINKHSFSMQIWVASPIKGGLHFSYNESSNTWISRENYELFSLVKKEISELFGVAIESTV